MNIKHNTTLLSRGERQALRSRASLFLGSFGAFSLALSGLVACEEQLDAPCGCSHEVPELSEQAHQLAIAGRWQPSEAANTAARSVNVPVTEAGSWQGESSCSGTFTEGAQALRRWLFDHWPQVSDVQGYSCRPINGLPSQTSIHAVGRALDIFIPLDNGEADNDLGDPVGNYLIEHANEIGIQRVIWDRTIWTSGGSAREYGGAHPHHDHLHIELSVPAGNMQTSFFTNGAPPPEMSACAPALASGGGVVDSDGPCLALYGPAQYWRSVAGEGHNGGLYWTNAWQSDNPANWARWRFSVSQSGRYALEIHSVAAYSVYSQVRYKVRDADGERTLTLNPAGRDGWVSLTEGRFEADGGEYFVDLFDNYTVDPGSDQHIIADALRVRALEGNVEPPPEAGTTPPPEAGTTPPPEAGTTPPPEAGTTPPPEAGTTPPPEAGTTPPPEAGTTPPPEAGTTPPPEAGVMERPEPNEPWIDPNPEGSSGGTIAYLTPEGSSNQKGAASGCDATGSAAHPQSTSGLMVLLLALFAVARRRLERPRA